MNTCGFEAGLNTGKELNIVYFYVEDEKKQEMNNNYGYCVKFK